MTPGAIIFSPQQLDAIVRDTVLPETDATHRLAVVAAIDPDGFRSALVFQRHQGGDWMLEAAFRHTWAGDNQIGAKMVFKL